MGEWRKAIPEARDRMQSRVLVWVAGLALATPCLWLLLRLVIFATGMAAPRGYHAYPHESWLIVMPWVVSLTFAVVVWVLRAATPMAAVCGGMVCLLVTSGSQELGGPARSGLTPLIGLFLLTFLATRAGKARKNAAGIAESSRGRNAAQVVANLGVAGLVAPIWMGWESRGFTNFLYPLAVPALLLAALCEATADTVSSEIGGAFGGRPWMVTTLQRVEPGSDGAVSVRGTLAGVVAAGIVGAVGMWAMRMSFLQAVIGFAGGVAGLFFDSLLGATVERRGWLGNDLVNFASTIFAVLFACWLLVCFA